MISFEPQAQSDPAVEDLQARFTAAIERLANEVGRLLNDIAAHPRYNEKVERTDALLKILELAAASARTLAEDIDRRFDRIAHLVALVEKAARTTEELANENVIHPASVIIKPRDSDVS